MAKKNILKESYPPKKDWSDEEIADDYLSEFGTDFAEFELYRNLSGYGFGRFWY